MLIFLLFLEARFLPRRTETRSYLVRNGTANFSFSRLLEIAAAMDFPLEIKSIYPNIQYFSLKKPTGEFVSCGSTTIGRLHYNLTFDITFHGGPLSRHLFFRRMRQRTALRYRA